MRLMVSGATASMERFAQDENLAPFLGAMVTPDTGNSLRRIATWGLPWCVDNAAFGDAFSPGRFLRLVEKAAEAPTRPLFVTVPDRVADHRATLDMFDRWFPLLESFGLPLAFVAQDGIEDVCDVPWGVIAALFIGGTTEFKDDIFTTCDLIPEAKRRNKWVHMGRVNTRPRIRLAVHADCNSVDGTSMSRFPDTYVPRFVRWSRWCGFQARKLDLLNARLEQEIRQLAG